MLGVYAASSSRVLTHSVTASVSSGPIVLSCPVNYLSLQTSSTLSPYNFSVPSSQWSLSFRDGYNINVLFIAEHHTFSLGARSLAERLCINDCLQSDAQPLIPPIVRSYREPTALCQTNLTEEGNVNKNKYRGADACALLPFPTLWPRENLLYLKKTV